MLLTVVCILFAFIVFLQCLNLKDSIGDRIASRSKKKNQAWQASLAPVPKVTEQPLGTRERVCPVCKMALNQEEYLICATQSKTNEAKVNKIHIYGCKHCFVSLNAST